MANLVCCEHLKLLFSSHSCHLRTFPCQRWSSSFNSLFGLAYISFMIVFAPRVLPLDSIAASWLTLNITLWAVASIWLRGLGFIFSLVSVWGARWDGWFVLWCRAGRVSFLWRLCATAVACPGDRASFIQLVWGQTCRLHITLLLFDVDRHYFNLIVWLFNWTLMTSLTIPGILNLAPVLSTARVWPLLVLFVLILDGLELPFERKVFSF